MVALELEVGVLEEEIGRLRAEYVTGNLLEANIDRMQSLYGKAIRDHPGDLEGMKRACMGVFYHMYPPTWVLSTIIAQVVLTAGANTIEHWPKITALRV